VRTVDTTALVALISLAFTAAFAGVAARAWRCRERACLRVLGAALVFLAVFLVALVTWGAVRGWLSPTGLPLWVTKGLGSALGFSAAVAALVYLVALVRSEEDGA